MNEHIQELITAYLHRGSTAEQERELFEACKRDPEIAEQLRQHLVLSLKLRQLRDGVTVGPDLHAAVAQRIDAAAPEHLPAAVHAPEPRRFRLAHLFGTGVATAAAAAALVLLLLPDADMPAPTTAAAVANVTDTMYIVKKDTVTQVREITRNVYVASSQHTAPEDAVGTSRQDDNSMAENRLEEDRVDENVLPADSASDATRAPLNGNALRDNDAPLLADARPMEALTPREKTRDYLEQYNTMLVSVASVQLTGADRITQ